VGLIKAHAGKQTAVRAAGNHDTGMALRAEVDEFDLHFVDH